MISLQCDGGELRGFCPPVYTDSCLRGSHGVITAPVSGDNDTQQVALTLLLHQQSVFGSTRGAMCLYSCSVCTCMGGQQALR